MSLLKALCLSLCLLCLANSRLLRPQDAREFSKESNRPGASTPNICHEGSIPNYDQKVYSGYLPVAEGSSSYLFYAFYYAQNATQDSSTPVTIWLNGGPGCSSMDGNFKEMGPYRLEYNSDTGEYDQVARPLDETWNANTHMLFIDQPVGTGYSLLNSDGDLVHSASDAAVDFYYALQQFYAISEDPCKFTDLQANPLFLFGESYAGHYVPAISKKILDENSQASSGTFKIPLKAIGIGDGLTDSPNQVTYYGLFSYALALIDDSDRMKVEYLAQSSYFLAAQGAYSDAMILWDELLGVIDEADGGMNVYNVYSEGNYDDSDLSDFCNSAQAQEQFGLVSDASWSLCSGLVYAQFSHDLMKSYASSVVDTLKEIPVLLYNGQVDLIVNSPGAQNWIYMMDWSDKDNFNQATYTPWNVTGEIIGYTKTYGNLNWVLVNQAGHMVPQDQPINAKLMFDNYIEKILSSSSTEAKEVIQE